MVGVPVQVPSATVRVRPSRFVPEMVGSAVLAGAAGLTTAVWAEVTGVVPPELLAVTTTRIVLPTSEGVWEYVDAVALEMSVQLAPAVSAAPLVGVGDRRGAGPAPAR